jgi:hypothetical protein
MPSPGQIFLLSVQKNQNIVTTLSLDLCESLREFCMDGR